MRKFYICNIIYMLHGVKITVMFTAIEVTVYVIFKIVTLIKLYTRNCSIYL